MSDAILISALSLRDFLRRNPGCDTVMVGRQDGTAWYYRTGEGFELDAGGEPVRLPESALDELDDVRWGLAA